MIRLYDKEPLITGLRKTTNHRQQQQKQQLEVVSEGSCFWRKNESWDHIVALVICEEKNYVSMSLWELCEHLPEPTWFF